MFVLDHIPRIRSAALRTGARACSATSHPGSRVRRAWRIGSRRVAGLSSRVSAHANLLRSRPRESRPRCRAAAPDARPWIPEARIRADDESWLPQVHEVREAGLGGAPIAVAFLFTPIAKTAIGESPVARP